TKQLTLPYELTINVHDVTNRIMTTINGDVSLTAWAGASNSVAVTPANSGNFTNGVWSGSITVEQPAANVTLNANDGSGHAGASNPFDVIAPNDISLTVDDAPDPVSVGANLTYTLTITNTGPADAT